MDILLFSCNCRKAEYFISKLNFFGHSVHIADTLASVHHTLRFSDPDFVIVDSETFQEPDHDYRTIIKLCKRKFLLFYDNELEHMTPSSFPVLSEAGRDCLLQIADVLHDIQIHRTLTEISFSATGSKERLFLRENRLRPSLALLLRCFLCNHDTDVDMATLLNLFWDDCNHGHQQTLYAYMNQLRFLLESRHVPLTIEKRNKGTYCLSIKKSCPPKETAL